MRTLFTAAVVTLALSSGAWAGTPNPSNTADKAAAAVTAFFPVPARSQAASATDAPLQASWDVTEPAATIRRQYRLGLDGLQAGSSAAYLNLLAPDYTQPGANRAKTTQRFIEMLVRNHCDSAQFSITQVSRKSADRLSVRVWQEFVFTSKNTPPTYVTTSPGKIHVVNNTGRLTLTQIVREEWVRSGKEWRMRRAETVAQNASIVL